MTGEIRKHVWKLSLLKNTQLELLGAMLQWSIFIQTHENLQEEQSTYFFKIWFGSERWNWFSLEFGMRKPQKNENKNFPIPVVLHSDQNQRYFCSYVTKALKVLSVPKYCFLSWWINSRGSHADSFQVRERIFSSQTLAYSHTTHH